MRNIKVVIEYDGTDYFGFQRLPGSRTIQGELERALSRITKESIKVTGAGRTDAGVHALAQVINFQTGGSIPTEKIAVAMNSLLPKNIVAKKAEEVPADFHARYSALSRAYKYSILNDELPSALSGRFTWHFPYGLDVSSMSLAARSLLGIHDFKSFCSTDAETRSSVREVTSLSVRRNANVIVCEIEANAFLHSMVRVIVGTLVEIGQGRRDPNDITRILEAKDRRLAGKTAPPQGLVLMEVTY